MRQTKQVGIIIMFKINYVQMINVQGYNPHIGRQTDIQQYARLWCLNKLRVLNAFLNYDIFKFLMGILGYNIIVT